MHGKNKEISASLVIIALSAVLFSCSDNKSDPVAYVNPYIGNISHLLVPTYPTVHIPNSMIRFYPDRESFTSNTLGGFPLSILSHRSEMVFSLMPFAGRLENSGDRLMYTYDNEKITPYLYSAMLDGQDIKASFAPSEKSGFFRFIFNEGPAHGIILKLRGGGNLDYSGNCVSGYDSIQGVKTYVYMELDKTPDTVLLSKTGILSPLPDKGNEVSAISMLFRTKIPDEVNIRYGLSYISTDQAKMNLGDEIKEWDINTTANKAREAWNSTLSKIEVEGGTADQRTVFYTSLYRCSERMVDITENGKYFSIWSNKVESANDTDFFTDDWVWDTHLALHPLQAILNPEKEDAKIASYIRMARQSGWMPTFPSVLGDLHCMNGNHSAAVILDAWNKGIKGFSLEEAYNYLKKTIMFRTRLPWVKDTATWLDRFYDKKGFYPALKKGEAETCPVVHPFEKRQAVAVTLATSYDDWCMARIARELGRDEDYRFFLERSLNYKKLFNDETGFYHPKDSTGNWIEPFDYRFDGGMGARDYYDENNGWTYIWQPLHGLNELIKMMGGPENFDRKLDLLFTEGLGKSKWQYYATMPDATGNVGQFVMGNEPSMHIAYLYNLAGEPWKTQKRVRMLMNTWFRNDLMGIPGDEDGGGLSAFYVFSTMGFYPITPGIPEYQIGSPLFSKIRIHLPGGKTFTILAKNNSPENKYIRSAKLNGKELTRPVFSHSDLAAGGTLVLEMGSKPEKTWGK